MVKQKVVIKVQMEDQKKRSKVMQTVAKHTGVASIGIEGDDKVAVVGDGIDAVKLTTVLRKKMRYADVLTVAPVKEKGGEKSDTEESKSNPSEPTFVVQHPYPRVYIHEPRQPDCCLM